MTLRLGVLAGVPCTRPDFIRAALDPRRDYLRHFASDPLAAWHGYATHVARPVQLLLEHAGRIGARARAPAGLADLAEATSSCDVVVVLAHWKGTEIGRDDLAAEASAAATAAALRSGGRDPTGEDSIDVDHAALARRLDRLPDDDLDALAALLHEHVHEPPQRATIPAGGFPTLAHPQTVAAERRAALDAALGALLHGGSRLELADGLHDVDAVDRAVAAGFAGILDLTICTSTTLARHIDRRRAGACRIVQFLSPLEPETACLALQQTIALLERGTTDYLAARARAIDDVVEAFAAASPPRAMPWWQRLVHG